MGPPAPQVERVWRFCHAPFFHVCFFMFVFFDTTDGIGKLVFPLGPGRKYPSGT